MKISPRKIPVLGTPVDVTTYAEAMEICVWMVSSGAPKAVSACNTHLVAMARHDPSFFQVLSSFDLILPDGYPLVWSMNRCGAGLEDRVYGPYFMQYALTHSPPSVRHFFFGGNEQTLARLQEAARKLNPELQIAGAYSPPFRAWTEEDEEHSARLIRESGADFIWVALGGGRQERWIQANLHRHAKGVFLAVGDAFELLAGSRPFAPAWMQRRGLTWLYRLWQEPRRLWPRYVRYNSLFLGYLVRDTIFGTPRRTARKVAFLGSRGVPARYSGFEVVVENLGAELVKRQYLVTVYNRTPKLATGTGSYRGMRLITLPTIPSKYFDTIVHTALSALHAVFQRYDVIYLCGVGNAAIGGLLKACGLKVVLNVDGADFRRAKWGTMARRWLHRSEVVAGRCAHKIIADNQEIVRRYEREYQVRPEFLGYGVIIRREKVDCGELKHWNLTPRGYILFVSRLTPENEAHLLLEAFRRWPGNLRLVICGSSNYEKSYHRKLVSLADERVLFTGARFGDSYLELSQNALFFVMPAAIEATRLVLLDQLGMGSAILYKEAAATREVLGDAGMSFAAEDPIASLAAKIDYLATHPEQCAELGRRALHRAETAYSWAEIAERYERLFDNLTLS